MVKMYSRLQDASEVDDYIHIIISGSMLKGKLAKMNEEYKKFAKEAAKEIFKFDWDEFEKSEKGSDIRKVNCQQIWKLFTYLNGAPANLRYGKAKYLTFM